MPSKITLKTKDICEALGIPKHQLRNWTESLPPYSLQATSERSARRFEPNDLLFFAVINQITAHLGLSTKFLQQNSGELYRCLKEPHSLVGDAFIFIDTRTCRFIRIGSDVISGEGVVVDITKAQQLVCGYLGLPTRQAQMPLGLVRVN